MEGSLCTYPRKAAKGTSNASLLLGMPRIFSSKVLFPCTFAQAAQGAFARCHAVTDRAAVWQKYPNPYAEHVRSVDVLDRRVCPDTGVIHTERIITVEMNAPRWIRRLLGTHGDTYVQELITVDPKGPSVELNSTKCVPELRGHSS